jgi:hypothetical protein
MALLAALPAVVLPKNETDDEMKVSEMGEWN